MDLLEINNFFSSLDIDFICSSPYKRAVDTIKPMAIQKQKPIVIDDRFRERTVGVDGQTAENLRHRWDDFSFCEPNGESLKNVQVRNIEALEEVLVQHSNETIVIGTHGTALSTIINFYNTTFRLDDFLDIIDLMPLIILFKFEGIKLKCIEQKFFIRKKYNGKNNLKELKSK